MPKYASDIDYFELIIFEAQKALKGLDFSLNCLKEFKIEGLFQEGAITIDDYSLIETGSGRQGGTQQGPFDQSSLCVTFYLDVSAKF